MIQSWIYNLVGSIIAIMITTPITMWLTAQSPIKMRVRLIKFLHHFSWVTKSPLDISGEWKAKYDYENNPDKEGGAHDLILYQFGRFIAGTSPLRKYKVIVVGEIHNDKIFNGIYYDFKDNIRYHGTFQVIYCKTKNKEDYMEGKWIGFNSLKGPEINSGIWTWEKFVRKIENHPV